MDLIEYTREINRHLSPTMLTICHKNLMKIKDVLVKPLCTLPSATMNFAGLVMFKAQTAISKKSMLYSKMV